MIARILSEVVQSSTTARHAPQVTDMMEMMVRSAIENLWVARGQLEDMRGHAHEGDEGDEDSETVIRFIALAESAELEAERALVGVLCALVDDDTNEPSGILDPDGDFFYALVPGDRPGVVSLAVIRVVDAGTDQGYSAGSDFEGDPQSN